MQYQSKTKNHQKKIYDPASFPYKIHNLHQRHAIFFPLYSFKRQLSKSTLIFPVAFLFHPKKTKTQVSHTKNPILPLQLPQIKSKPPNHIYIRDNHQILFQ